MKEVIAYQAENGKLFLSKEDCLNYEREKKKFPFIQTFHQKVNGDIPITYVEEFQHNSKTNVQKIDSYYMLKNYKIRLPLKLSYFTKLPLIGNLYCNDYISFFINLIYQFDNIDNETFVKYTEYYKRHAYIENHKYIPYKDLESAFNNAVHFNVRLYIEDKKIRILTNDLRFMEIEKI